MHKQQGWLQAWEYCQAKLIQTLVRASQGVDWSWSQCIKSHHAQTSSGKSYQATSEPETTSDASYLGCGEKELSGPKSSFQMKVNFAFHLETRSQSLEKSREAQIPCCLKSSVKFPQSVMIWAVMSSAGVGPLCFLKSTVNAAIYQDILEHFMLPSADKLYGDADFIFQQDLAPAHTAKGTKSWFQWPWCYCAWLASKLAWPEPHRESMGYCQEEDERHQTQQCRWAEGHCQRNWASIPPQQCHKLITSMPRRIEAVIKAKGAPTKYWVHIQ